MRKSFKIDFQSKSVLYLLSISESSKSLSESERLRIWLLYIAWLAVLIKVYLVCTLPNQILSYWHTDYRWMNNSCSVISVLFARFRLSRYNHTPPSIIIHTHFTLSAQFDLISHSTLQYVLKFDFQFRIKFINTINRQFMAARDEMEDKIKL